MKYFHLSKICTVEFTFEGNSGQQETSFLNISRANTANLRALPQNVNDSSQPLCSGASPNDKVIEYPQQKVLCPFVCV